MALRAVKYLIMYKNWNIYMKFKVYLKNKWILKIIIFLFKACIDVEELVDCF